MMEYLLLALAGGGGLAWLGVRLRSKRAQGRDRAEDLAQVRKLCEEDITLLGEQLRRLDAETASHPLDDAARLDYQTALDAYESAQRTVRRITDADEISKVTDTLSSGRYALACVQARVAGRPLPELRVPCFFNPQHGPSVIDLDFTPPRPGHPPSACLRDGRRPAQGGGAAGDPRGRDRRSAGAVLRGRCRLLPVRRGLLPELARRPFHLRRAVPAVRRHRGRPTDGMAAMVAGSTAAGSTAAAANSPAEGRDRWSSCWRWPSEEPLSGWDTGCARSDRNVVTGRRPWPSCGSWAKRTSRCSATTCVGWMPRLPTVRSTKNPGSTTSRPARPTGPRNKRSVGSRIPDEIGTVTEPIANGHYALARVQARALGEPVPKLRVPCFFNPQHGPSVYEVAFTLSGHGTHKVPACASDAARVRAQAEAGHP